MNQRLLFQMQIVMMMLRSTTTRKLMNLDIPMGGNYEKTDEDQWKSGILLTGNQRYFMTFEALYFFDISMEEYAERKVD